jgi:hypothetical protein
MTFAEEFTWTDPRIPIPERHTLFVRCPRCRRRIWNQLFSQAIVYQAHYLDHILADLKKDVEC